LSRTKWPPLTALSTRFASRSESGWSDWPAQWRPLVELAAEMHAAFAAAAGTDAEPDGAPDRGGGA
jgi:hypothetical protein